MHFMYLIKAIHGALRVKRADWKRCEYTERRKDLFQLLYETIFSGGITVCTLEEQTSCTTTHILMDVIYNIERHKY